LDAIKKVEFGDLLVAQYLGQNIGIADVP